MKVSSIGGKDRLKGPLGNLFAAWPKPWRQGLPILFLLLLIGTVAAYRWIQLDGNLGPPGSDGGQWLAFSHQMFSGERVKAGFERYPPMVPLLLGFLTPVLPPLLALKILGILASVVISIPVYLLLRTAISPWLAAVLAAAVPLAPYHSEVLMFGGYPQMLGTAFLVLSVFLLVKGLHTGQVRWFLGAGLATAMTIGTNVLPAVQALAAGGAVLLISPFRLRHEGWSVVRRRLGSALLWWGLLSAALVLPFSSAYLGYFTTGYFSTAAERATNPLTLALLPTLGWLGSAWRWEFLLWLSILVVMLPAAIKATLGRKLLLADATAGLVVCAVVVLLLFRELRSLQVIEISLVLSVGILVRVPISMPWGMSVGRFSNALTLIPWRQIKGSVGTALATALVLVVVLAVVVVGERRSRIAYDWYLVLNPSALSALDWLRANGHPGARVVATGGPRGNNYGWWIEGYAHLPTYMVGNPVLFSNVGERAQVAFARRLLVQETAPQAIKALAEGERIQFLFLDKRVLHRTAEELLEADFVMRLENHNIIVMERAP